MSKLKPKLVHEALRQVVIPTAGHLDLEGFAYIKVVRTHDQQCFAQDVTSEVLKDQGYDIAHQNNLWWKTPAWEKWDRKRRTKDGTKRG